VGSHAARPAQSALLAPPALGRLQRAPPLRSSSKVAAVASISGSRDTLAMASLAARCSTLAAASPAACCSPAVGLSAALQWQNPETQWKRRRATCAQVPRRCGRARRGMGSASTHLASEAGSSSGVSQRMVPGAGSDGSLVTGRHSGRPAPRGAEL